MGKFSLQRSEVTLEFKDNADLNGLEVQCNLDVPLSVFLEFQDNISGSDEEGGGSLRRAFEIFADEVLVSWNMTNGTGKAVPADREGFFKLSPRYASAIMTNWSTQVTDVPDPLGVE